MFSPIFKICIIDDDQKINDLNFDLFEYGIVLDFNPTNNQKQNILDALRPVKLKATLFTVEDRLEQEPIILLVKQIMHYIDTYGFGNSFELNDDQKQKTHKVQFIRGRTKKELSSDLQNYLSQNIALGDKELDEITRFKNVDMVNIDVNQINNNEVRIRLFNPDFDKFDNGDECVRYIVWETSNKTSTLVIKSDKVISQVRQNAHKISEKFLTENGALLANVFNRHKRLIVPLKSHKAHKPRVNRISKLSKKLHVPVVTAPIKNFVTNYGQNMSSSELAKVDSKELFKILNLLEYKKLGLTDDIFMIRNGKVHLEPNRTQIPQPMIEQMEDIILSVLRNRFSSIKPMLIDSHIDYGLPVSGKQTCGNLPFGTQITCEEGSHLASGIYWERDWGSDDLDLAYIDLMGNRVGWNTTSSFNSDTDCPTFSGDVTEAWDGATEFFVTRQDARPYGLFVSIYSGMTGSKCEIMFGPTTVANPDMNSKTWISDVLMQETIQLNSRGNLIGFIKGNKFIVQQYRLNSDSVSSPKDALFLKKAMCDIWTVSKLFNRLGLSHKLVNEPLTQGEYTDLTYSGFIFDKLANALEGMK